jgi:glycosyltransferase involved in cell wall biosynthesis
LRIAMVGSRGIPAHYSGIEASLQEICPRLVERGHRVLVHCAAATAPGKNSYAGVFLRKLPAIYTKHLETASRTLLSTLEELFGTNDIVHFHALGPALLSILPRLVGKRTVVTIHGLDWRTAKWGTAARGLLKVGEWASVRFPDATIVVSRSLEEYFRQRHGRQVACIPNGVNIRQPRERKALSSIGLGSAPYILFVSRLIPGKGLDCLVRAFNRVKSDRSLVIAGDAPYDRSYVESLKIIAEKNVIFPGFVTGPLLEELFSNADLYVHPAPAEGLSMSVLEAMSYANCVLASDIPPNRELLGDNGFYFRPGDVRHLGEMMTRLMAHRPMAREKGLRARELVRRNYNWERIVDRIERVYDNILRRKGIPLW